MPWTRSQMAARAARELHIGISTRVLIFQVLLRPAGDLSLKIIAGAVVI